MKNIVLNNGVEIPPIVLGTYPIKGSELMNVVNLATRYGYRAYDTSDAYKNEQALGEGIRKSGLNRKSIFISTKLSNRQQKTGNIKKSLEKSMEYLGVDYIDLYLMHWPNPGTFLDSWIQMEQVYKEGKVRSIGVCNFHKQHFDELLRVASIIPVINQIEIHPLLSQKPLLKYCCELNIKGMAYTPLARMHEKLISNNILNDLSHKYNKSVPQIILRWDYQLGLISVPKSSNDIRLKENISIFDFELSNDEIAQINRINEDYRIRYNP